MKLYECKTHSEMTEGAKRWCQDRLTVHKARSIFLPAGNTPTALFRSWEADRPEYLNGVRLVQIDDVATGPQRGKFTAYFEQNLPSFRRQLSYISGCEESADLAILGFGLNGHVAYHEPGVPHTFHSGCVRLSEESRAALGTQEETWGVTYGLGAFLRTRAVLLMVSGEKKKPMFRRFLEETDTFPAAALKAHPDMTVLVDFDWR